MLNMLTGKLFTMHLFAGIRGWKGYRMLQKKYLKTSIGLQSTMC